MSRSQSVDERARQQLDLCRKQKRQLEALEASQQLERIQLEAKQREQAEQLKQRHVRELVDLWQEQGRKIGPWAAPVLEGRPPAGMTAGGKVGHG